MTENLMTALDHALPIIAHSRDLLNLLIRNELLNLCNLFPARSPKVIDGNEKHDLANFLC